MPKTEQLLTTQAFSKKVGVSAATVTKWLNSGKIKGKKEGNKWLIAASELKKTSRAKPKPSNKEAPAKVKSKSAQLKKKTTAKAAKPKAPAIATEPAHGAKSFSVQEFSDITYLTAFGVEKWLKEGRLTGGVDASGQKRIDAANLENPIVKRLVR